MALTPDSVNEAESKKFEEEFDQYQAKLKDQKEAWAKEHPDQVGNDKSSVDLQGQYQAKLKDQKEAWAKEHPDQVGSKA